MVTVSEIGWYKSFDGKCPQCGRERPLGHINTDGDEFNSFAPPMEYWDMCDSCGQLYVGEHCDNPKCEIGKNWQRL
jgi:methionyl-tRNA synthetase